MTEPISDERWEEIKGVTENPQAEYCTNCKDMMIDLLTEVSRLRAERPTRYTPREEVRQIVSADGTAWFTCSQMGMLSRVAAEFWVDHLGGLMGRSPWSNGVVSGEHFADFLPIPDYLISGLESEVKS